MFVVLLGAVCIGCFCMIGWHRGHLKKLYPKVLDSQCGPKAADDFFVEVNQLITPVLLACYSLIAMLVEIAARGDKEGDAWTAYVMVLLATFIALRALSDILVRTACDMVKAKMKDPTYRYRRSPY